MEQTKEIMPANTLAMEMCDVVIKSTIELLSGITQTIYTLKPNGVNSEYIVRGLNLGFKECGLVVKAEHVVYSTKTKRICAKFSPVYFECPKEKAWEDYKIIVDY